MAFSICDFHFMISEIDICVDDVVVVVVVVVADVVVVVVGV